MLSPPAPETDARRGDLNEAIRRAVAAIPRGSVATYGDIAEAVEFPCTARQVGRALRNSPPGLRLPWHRVLAAGGRIALPDQSGAEQRFRLREEGVPFAGKRVRIERCRYHYERPGCRPNERVDSRAVGS